MFVHGLFRRDFMIQGGAAVTAAATLAAPMVARAFPASPGEVVVPWLDQPPPIPDVAAKNVVNLLRWEDVNSWLTPNERFFQIKHYNWPEISERDWKLDVMGLVQRPLSLTLADLKARPRRDLVFTLECSGNHGFPWLVGAVGTAKWTGTPLAAVLEAAGIQDRATEVIFFGADAGEEELRGTKMPTRFARSMSVADAMAADNLLCFEMNGASLPRGNGFPLRLIAPGWFGIANVKWLTRIEVSDTRYMGRFQARDYVTIREQQHHGAAVAVETSVGRLLLKSVPTKVTVQDGRARILGAAWGAPIAAVEVRIDDGPWRPATLDRSDSAPYAWTPWSFDWGTPAAGEHTVTVRAIDTAGRIQPATDDPAIATKRTYWESNGQVTRRVRLG